jgi:hypothetical protein
MESPKQHKTSLVDSIQKSPQIEECQAQEQSDTESPLASDSLAPAQVQESQLKGIREHSPSPIDAHASLYDASPPPPRNRSSQSTQNRSNQNSNGTPPLNVLGYPVNQKDLNMAVILLGVGGLLTLGIIVLLLVTIGFLYHSP